jgi:hypothetical protein
MIYELYLLIMLNTLLLRPSLHFTQLHFTPLHYTCRHFTSSHLNFTQLQFTLASSRFNFLPLHFTSRHYTSRHFTSLLHRLSYPSRALYSYSYKYQAIAKTALQQITTNQNFIHLIASPFVLHAVGICLHSGAAEHKSGSSQAPNRRSN